MEPEALAKLYDQHAAALVLYARQWTDCPEDVVQQAFLKLSTQSDVPQQPRGWLFRVVRNAAISSRRSLARRRRREASVQRQEIWFDAVDQQLEIGEAMEVLESLEASQREAVVARLWGEVTFDELAELQGCSRATAHRRYCEALTELKKRLEPCPNTTTH